MITDDKSRFLSRFDFDFVLVFVLIYFFFVFILLHFILFYFLFCFLFVPDNTILDNTISFFLWCIIFYCINFYSFLASVNFCLTFLHFFHWSNIFLLYFCLRSTSIFFHHFIPFFSLFSSLHFIIWSTHYHYLCSSFCFLLQADRANYNSWQYGIGQGGFGGAT